MGALLNILRIVDAVGKTAPEVGKIIKGIKGKNQRGRRAVVPLLVKFMMLETTPETVADVDQIVEDTVEGDAQMRAAVTASYKAVVAAKQSLLRSLKSEKPPPSLRGD